MSTVSPVSSITTKSSVEKVQFFGLQYFRNSKRKQHVKGEKGEPGVGFRLDDQGNYDIQNKNLRNIGLPVLDNDAVHLGSLARIEKSIADHSINYMSLQVKHGTQLANLEKQVEHVKDSTEKSFREVDQKLNSQMTALDRQGKAVHWNSMKVSLLTEYITKLQAVGANYSTVLSVNH